MNKNGAILKQVFQNGKYSKEQQKSTLNNAVRIYNKMPNKDNNLVSNVGLVVGRVQSGKTANIITLSALALDNGHKIVVLFLSDTNNLLDQNTNRFLNCFDNIVDVEVIKKSKDGNFDRLDVRTLNYLYKNNKKLVICSLKHAKHIKEIKDLIGNSPYKDDYALIIDDEGDDIGLNTASFSDKFVEDKKSGLLFESGRSSTNKSIVSLKTTFDKLGYISLTATPEANVMLQDFQQLAPDYCVTLEPNKGYTGLLTFHGENSNRVVEVGDYSTLNDADQLPASFEDAFVFFVAGCIVRAKREGQNDFKHSMMVHPCHKIDNHKTVYSKVKQFVDKIEDDLKRNNTSGKRFIGEVEKQYKQLSPQDTFVPQSVYDVISGMSLHLVNSDSDGSNLQAKMSLMPYHIVIGGNMLDRGITIEGLAVTYMIRMSKKGQMDTMLQRARWFGYKESYIDLCRVYMPKELKNQFENLIEAEESVWQFLYDCDRNNLSPKSLEPYFYIPSNLNIAAANKASYIAKNLISSVKTQTEIVHDPKKNQANVSLVNNIDWTGAAEKAMTSSQIHRMKTIGLDDFKDFMSKFAFSESDSSMNASDIAALVGKIKPKQIDLWDIRYKTGEERSTDDYRIRALLQGYSENKSPNDADYYVGDRNLKSNNLSLQIHHVKLKNDIDNQYKKGDQVIMLALVMPDGYISGFAIKKMSRKDIKGKLN